jgi:hypothetical protein
MYRYLENDHLGSFGLEVARRIEQGESVSKLFHERITLVPTG